MERSTLRRVLLSMFTVLAASGTSYAQFGPDVPPACVAATQGRIPWNAQGDVNWAPQNIVRLCRGGRDDQPARCFQRLMSGTVNYGGGAQWEWENAVRLCGGSRSAAATIGCFQGALRAGRPWQEAIPLCNASAAQPGPPAIVAPPPPPPPPPPVADPIAECRNALQGRVAWNHEGNTSWAPENIERLCRNGRGDQPARCFQRLMSGSVDYGGGTRWEWENASRLCAGTRNAALTVSCFQGQLRGGHPWQEAITLCAQH